MNIFRNVTVSEECKEWLRKSSMTGEMEASKAECEFEGRCAAIQQDVLRAIITESAEPASPDGKAEIVAEVRLERTALNQVMRVITLVYAVVYMSHNRKYYVVLDDEGNPKKVYRLNEYTSLKIKKGEYFDHLTTVKRCKYIISM